MGTKDPAPLPETISAQERFISTYRMSPVGAGKRGRQHRSHRHHQHRKLGQFGLIMTIGLTLDAMKPGIHCARTHWILGFMTFRWSGACEP